MDETTKILVATFSGFIVAFLAEPVKLFFQNLIKKNSLRHALYNELYHNYLALKPFVDNSKKYSEEKLKNLFVIGIKYIIQTECYHYFINREADLYYQLSEATSINLLYANLRLLAEFDTNEKIKMYNPQNAIEDFFENFISLTREGTLSKKIFDKVAGKGTARKIIDKTAAY